MLKKLWRWLFPVKIRYVMNYIDSDFDQHSTEEEIFHELTQAQEKCPEMFTAMGIELMRIEGLIHAETPIRSQDDLIAWAVNTRALIKSANVLKGRINLPAIAAGWLDAKLKEKEDKKELKTSEMGDYDNF